METAYAGHGSRLRIGAVELAVSLAAHVGEERLPAGQVYDEVPLAADHRVIRFDLPGFGLTGPDPEGLVDAGQERARVDRLDHVVMDAADRAGSPRAHRARPAPRRCGRHGLAAARSHRRRLPRLRGLDGEHGVIIPSTNVAHLMLREDVVAAVAAVAAAA